MQLDQILLILSVIINLIMLFLVFKLNNKEDGEFFVRFQEILKKLLEGQEGYEKSLKEEMSTNRIETAKGQKDTREEVVNSIKSLGDSLSKNFNIFAKTQDNNFKAFSEKLTELTDKNEARMKDMRENIEKKLESIQKDNNTQLEKMRATVDEKLTETLDKRLTQKFKLVSDQLDKVHKGLGEMQDLAQDVDNLEKVLSNIKTRGTWGEVQLSRLLEQILTPHQYDENVSTKGNSRDRVEFAIKIPSKDKDNKQSFIYLPIDVKFPTADYQRLLEAQENADTEGVADALKALSKRIKEQAKYIHEKYIDPPNTTDFGVLYLPTEGLYAEVTRQIGLCEELQRDYQIVVMGPNTVAAFLNSLQMGFRTLAIEERTNDVWELLGEIKKQFGKFGVVLAKTKKKLQEASNVIDKAATRNRVIQKRLEKVEQLPMDKG